MASRSRRLFVGNLPNEVTRDDVIAKFKEYGTVESIDIKSKKDPSSGQTSNTFCFVNLNTDDSNLNNCLLLVNGIKWGERNIKVDVAKESFLQRLEKERQEKKPTSAPPLTSFQKPSWQNLQKSTEKIFKNESKVEEVTEKKSMFSKKSRLSDSSGSEEEDCQPNGRLQKFGGIASLMSHESHSTVQSTHAKVETSKFEHREAMNVGRNMSVSHATHSQQQSRVSNDFVSRMELFSDVWKDENESGNSRFNSFGNRERRTAFEDKDGPRAFDNRERQGGFGSRERNAFEDQDRSGGFRNRERSSDCGSRERNTFGDLDRPSGFGNRETNAFGDRDRPSGFGNRERNAFEDGDKPSRFGNRERNAFGDKDRPSGFGNRERNALGDKDRPSGFGNRERNAYEDGNRPSGFGNRERNAFGESDQPRGFRSGERSAFENRDRPIGFGSSGNNTLEDSNRFSDFENRSRTEALHTIDSPKPPFQSEDNNAAIAAEERRLKSIEARRNAFEQQKKAIQQALSDKSGPQINKKIKFSENESDEETSLSKSVNEESRQNSNKLKENQKSRGLSLFDDSDDEADNDDFTGNFQVKKQFEGEKGKKLLELQSKFNNDDRFKLDERFYDSDGDEESGRRNPNKTGLQSQQEEGIEGLAEEREQQLQILSSILGKPISVAQPTTQKESKTMGMLRFDPSKPNHSKYELTKKLQVKKKKSKTKPIIVKGKEEDEYDEAVKEEEAIKPKVRREEKEPEPVSQSKFFSVSDDLAETLKRAKEGQSSGFSLLQMFGTPVEPAESKENQKAYPGTAPKKELKRPIPLNGSFSEEDSEPEGPTATMNSAVLQLTSAPKNGVISTGGLWQESFFLQPQDSRLKESADFFSKLDEPTIHDRTKFRVQRDALKLKARKKKTKAYMEANSLRMSQGKKKQTLWDSSNRDGRGPRKRQKF